MDAITKLNQREISLGVAGTKVYCCYTYTINIIIKIDKGHMRGLKIGWLNRHMARSRVTGRIKHRL